MLPNAKGNRLADNIAMVILFLMALGTVFVFSASANLSQEFDLRHFYSFTGLRQILFFPVAYIVMFTVARLDYHRFSFANGWSRSLTSYLLALSLILLVLVLVPQIGAEINRARRWLRIPVGPIVLSFQPSELAKWALVFFLPAVCHQSRNQINLYWKRFVPVCCVVAAVVGLIVVEDFGTAVFIALISFLILGIGGIRWWHLLTPLPFAVAVFSIALYYSPARFQRIEAFLNPQKWTASTAYQANQSLIAIGSGGLLGKGLGRGTCKYGHLPEDTTDFVFAIVGEELGFVGTSAIIGLFIMLVWIGILVVVRCRDHFGQLLAAGIVLTIAGQAALNIAVVTVMLPTKGIPLPFVSAGGTSMLLSSAAVGVLMNIAAQSPPKRQHPNNKATS